MNENLQIQELREQLHAYSKERLVELNERTRKI